jgi:hypothetical protein
MLEDKKWKKLKEFFFGVWTSMRQAKDLLGGDKGIWLENVNQLSFD